MKNVIRQVKHFAGCMLLLAGVLVAGRASATDDTCYVESTAGTYIDTGYYPCPETKIEVDFQFTDATTTQQRVFGIEDQNSLSSVFYINSLKIFTFSHKDGSVVGIQTGLTADTGRHTAILDAYNGGAQNGVLQVKTGDTVIYDGVLNQTRTKRSAYPLHFFASNTGTKDGGGAKMRFYGAKIWEKGELVRNYVPCVRNGLVGIKDLVTGAFQYPTDLTVLTAGPGVTPETTSDGYLESAGDDCIDTGYVPTQNTRIEADFEMVETNNVAQPRICGSSGLIYEFYLNSAHRYAFAAFDGAVTQTGGTYGYYTSTSKPADIGVRHTFFVDYYRKRAALTTSGETRLIYAPLASKMTATRASSSLHIFSNGGAATGSYSKAKLYGLRIYETGKLVHDYVPCVQDGANGLFDTVTEQFITFAAGTKGRVGGDVMVREDKAYVETTVSGSYVETDYFPCPETRIEADFRFMATTPQSRVFGVQDTNNLSSTFYANSKSIFTFSHKDGATAGIQTFLDADTERHTAILDSYNGGAQNGVLQLKTGETVFWEGSLATTRTKRSAYPLHFFGENEKTSEFGPSLMRFYGAKIYEKGELVRDYVPYVRNGLVGIKDRVTGVFHYSMDTAPLSAGPGVKVETTSDGYLESTGSDYIDTGYKPTQNTRIEADFEMLSTNNVTQPRICGSSGLIYEFYLNGAHRYAFAAFDGAVTHTVGTIGYYTSTSKPADIGVRHTFFVDYYRKRAALTTAGEARLSYALASKMTAVQASGSLLIFSGNTNVKNLSKTRLYGFRIFESGVLVHDYVPCVQDELMNGLYDKVTGQFLWYGCGKVGGDVLKRGTDACLISDGTQGIVSDYYVNPNSKIVVDFSYNDVATKQQRVFGADSDNKANPLSCSCYLNGGGNLTYCFSDGAGAWTLTAGAAIADTRYVMTLDGPNSKVSVKGGTYDYIADIKSTRTQTSSQPLGIFMDYENGFVRVGANIRLYSLKCYDNGTLVRQYLPYKSGDKIGLYDTVSGKVFLSTRTGAHPFEIRGMGTDGSGSALLVTPKDTRAKWSKPAVLKAFAPGAIAYRWFEGETEIVGETGAELSVAQQPGRELVTYSVKPVFEVGGEQVEGAAASATVDHSVVGMTILVR